MLSHRQLLSLALLLGLVALDSGCGRTVPPTFSPAQVVTDLTKDIEEPEELKEYQGLQADIAKALRHYCGTPDKLIALGEEFPSTQLKQGFVLYQRYCSQCHGVNGDGNGLAAEYLEPKPRNYTYGIFKFTSTPYGKKPRRADLIRTVQRGITGTSMPSFDRFSETDLKAVVEYVVALSQRGEFERVLADIAYNDGELPDEDGMKDVIQEIVTPWGDSSAQIVMPVSPMPPYTAESVAQGHKLFLDNACNKCHGKYGRGGSIEKVEVGVDTWGNHAAAADLSSGMLRGGDRPLDIYRRIYSGINGTPMPAFDKLFQEDPDAIWRLVHFIKATGERRRLNKAPLSEADLPIEATPAEQPSDTAPEAGTEPAAEAA